VLFVASVGARSPTGGAHPHEREVGKMRRVILLIVAVLTLAVVFTAPASAAPEGVEFTCVESIWKSVSPPTEEWYSDGIYHSRDETWVFRSTGDPYCAGLLYVTFSYNFSDVWGTGELWGTWYTELKEFRGSGFQGTFTEKLDFTAEVFGTGSVVGTGYGQFEGWQFRSTITEVVPGYAIETGYAFQPGE
jgi:hypothetical protein